MTMRILMVGDIVGSPGRTMFARVATRMKESGTVDFVMANAENSAGGRGITERLVGPWRVFITYMAGGVVGAVASVTMLGQTSLGASAAILGLVGLLLALQVFAGHAIPARFKLPTSTWIP